MRTSPNENAATGTARSVLNCARSTTVRVSVESVLFLFILVFFFSTLVELAAKNDSVVKRPRDEFDVRNGVRSDVPAVLTRFDGSV